MKEVSALLGIIEKQYSPLCPYYKNQLVRVMQVLRWASSSQNNWALKTAKMTAKRI